MAVPSFAVHSALGAISSYAVLVPVGIIGGQMAAFAAGAVATTGFFNPVAVYIVFTAGDILTDSLYYYLGRRDRVQSLARRYGRKVGIAEAHFDTLRAQWLNRTFRTMLISKYSLALAGPLLISAGMARVSARRFYLYAIGISLVQYALFVPLGYYFAESFTAVSAVLKAVQVVAALVVFAYVFVTFRRLAHASLHAHEVDTR